MTLTLTPLTPGSLSLTADDLGDLEDGIPFGGSCLVASADAPQAVRDRADYVCDGIDDQDTINEAITNLGPGGLVFLSEGDFDISSRIRMFYDGVTLAGTGTGYPSGTSTSDYEENPSLSGTRIKLDPAFTDEFAIDCRPSMNVFTFTTNVVPSLTNPINGAASHGGLIQIDSAGHGFTTGQTVVVSGVLGTTEANGTWVITVISSRYFDLVGSAFVHTYVASDDDTVERPQNIVLDSVAGLPASGEVWIQGSTLGTGAPVSYQSITGSTLVYCLNVPAAVAGARVNYAPRSLTGIGLRDFSLDGSASGGFIDTNGIYLQAFATLLFNIRVQRFGRSGIVSDGGGSTTSTDPAIGPRGSWDNRYLAVQVRQCNEDCIQLIAGSTDNIIGADTKIAAWGNRGIYIQVGSGAQIVGNHFYGAPTATGAAIDADARQLEVFGCRFANLGSGAVQIDGLNAQGGQFSLVGLNIRDANVLNPGTKDAINIRANDGATLRGGVITGVVFGTTADGIVDTDHPDRRPRYLINLDDVDDNGVPYTTPGTGGSGVFYDVVIGDISWGYQNSTTSTYKTAAIRVGRPATIWPGVQIKQIRKGVTFALTDAATIAVDCENGDYQTISTNASRTMGAPANLLPGYELTFEMLNNGGAGALAWNAVYHLSSAWVNPANGVRQMIRFRTPDGVNLYEVNRATASISTDALFSAKGDLIAGTGASASAKLTVGSNDQVLTADSSQTTGMKWAASALADGSVTSAKIADGAIADVDVNASAAIAETKLSLASDAAAGTASRRSLGTGATQAAAGNDSRLSDTRTPTDGTVTDAKIATTLSPSKITGTAVVTADSRLSDSRTPTAHVHSGTDITSGTVVRARLPAGVVVDDTVWDAKGDLVVGTAADTALRLAVGSNNQILVADSAQTTGVKWAALPSGGYIAVDTIWDAKGDLVAGTGADAAAKVTVGSNNQVLTADSAQSTGVKWATPVTVATDTIFDTKGDLVAATAADTAAKLAVGSNNQLLIADSSQTTGLRWSNTRERLALASRNILSESTMFQNAGSSGIPTTGTTNGTIGLSLLGLRAGDVVNNIIVWCVTVGTSLTFTKLALYDSAGVFIRATAECSASFNTTGGVFKVIPLTSSYTVTTDGSFYCGYLQFGSGATGATLARPTQVATSGQALSGGIRSHALVSSQTDLSGNLTLADGVACYWFAVN